MNPKLMSRWLYAGEDLTEKSGQTDRQTNRQTDGHHLDVRHTKALRAIIGPVLAYTRRARVALRPFVWKTFGPRQSDVDHEFSSAKS